MVHITILITLFLLFFPTSSADHLKLITTRLIHRDSNLSPFHNVATILDDRATRMVETSLARHAYLSSISNDKLPSVEARMSWGIKNNVFYVNFSIGDPPVPQLALLDTGSGLLWLRCPPCGQTSQGVFATEQLTFRTSDGGTATVPKLLFGCSTLETGHNDLDPRVNGILGLGTWTPGMPRGAKSLVTQLGSKFSYCVGRGSVDREAKGFPVLGLHFVGGAELIMDNFGMFLQVRQGIFCLAIVRSEMVTGVPDNGWAGKTDLPEGKRQIRASEQVSCSH
ncbi:Probable aspartic protease At2g35615 [Linum perenne]